MKNQPLKILKPFLFLVSISLISSNLIACGREEYKPSATLTPEPSATPTTAPTQVPTPTSSNNDFLLLFEDVWSTVNETYFDPEFGGVDWEAIHDEYEPHIREARDNLELYHQLNQMLWELNVSHIGVVPVEMWPSVEPVISEDGETGLDVRLLEGQAVITRVEEGSSAEQAGLRMGYVIQSIGGKSVQQILAEAELNLAPPYTDQGRIDILTRQLLSMIYGDPGTCVALDYLDEKDELLEKCLARRQRPREAHLEGAPLPPFYLEFESTRLERNIGYIRFNTFHPDLIPDITAAVAALKDAPGIIIDLRGNPGGNPVTSEQMAALFLEGQATLGNWEVRSGTIPWIVAGKNVYSGPLVILIDALSFSASELFASGMQELGRATIVGERSPGGATGANVKILPNEVILFHPVIDGLTADGAAIEGRGVIPEISIILQRSQLLQGIDAQLQAAIDYLVEHPVQP